MPFTFCHPAAVLPLRKIQRRWISLPALMIGSMMPDLGYFFPFTEYFWLDAHTLERGFTFCVPAGLVVFGLYRLFYRQLRALSPEPLRGKLAADPPPLDAVALLALPLNLLVGAWSHFLWDSFTHRYGWF